MPQKKRTRKPNAVCSHEDFVLAWMKHDSYAELAEATGLSVSGVGARAKTLRKLGVPLPPKRGIRESVDVKHLTSLIEG